MLSISRLFPILAIIVAVLAYTDPSALMNWQNSVMPLLALIMFCLGLTLRTHDFKRIWNHPQPIALAIIIQFTIMPLAAFALAKIFSLSNELTIGMIVVGAFAGGTASNVMTFLARGDVALSVSMTIASTLWALIATPWIIGVATGEFIQLDSLTILLNAVFMVLLPMVLGMLITHLLPAFAGKVNQYLTDIASGLVLLIIAITVSTHADEVASLSYTVLAAVIIHNLIGLISGYIMGKLTKQTEVVCRTLAIEIAMQNSALATSITLKSFGPIAALVSSLFGIWQYVSSAIAAGIWRWLTDKRIREVEAKRAGRVQQFNNSAK